MSRPGYLREANGRYYGQVTITHPVTGKRKQFERALGPKRGQGSTGGLTRREAYGRLGELAAELVAELTPEEVVPTHDETIADLHPFVLAEIRARGRKRSTIEDYVGYLKQYVAFSDWATRPARLITKRDVQQFRDHQLALPGRTRGTLAPSTVRNQLAFLHSIFKYAQGEGIVPINPVAHVAKPQDPHVYLDDEDDGDSVHMEQAEVEALLRSAADDYLGPTDRVLWLVAVLTGMRQGELRALRWRHVDFQANKIYVRRSISRGEQTTPKSKMSRREVPLDPRAARALKEHLLASRFKGADDFVFVNPHARNAGNAYDDSKMRKRFYEALRRSGMPAERIGRPQVTFHSLRHTYGTMMGQIIESPRRLQEFMGHENITTTQRYMGKAPVKDDDLAYVARAFASL